MIYVVICNRLAIRQVINRGINVRSKNILGLIIFLVLLNSFAFAEIRMYRQIKDISVNENSVVRQSKQQKDLFECTYEINYEQKYVKRIMIRRLDEPQPRPDDTLYFIAGKADLFGSPAGNGGETIIAMEKNGRELVELGRRFSFSSRVSPFAQIITGVYKRVYPFHPQRRFGR